MPQSFGPLPGGSKSKLGANATALIFSGQGVAYRICVTTAGSTNGTLYDTNDTAAVAAGNEIFSVPDTVGIYTLKWPCKTGLVFVPGTGQVASLSYGIPS